jgi:hypothetical protein
VSLERPFSLINICGGWLGHNDDRVQQAREIAGNVKQRPTWKFFGYPSSICIELRGFDMVELNLRKLQGGTTFNEQ